jgi:hypothetical protein
MCNATFGWQIFPHASILVDVMPVAEALSLRCLVFNLCICAMIDHTNWN